MVKSLSTNALDAALDYIAARADLMTLCAGAPADVGEAAGLVGAGGKALATVALAEGAGSADFAIGDAQTNGRRLTIAAQSAVPVVEAGTIDHVALVDTTGGELLAVAELTEVQAVSAGEVISVKAFGGEILAPA